MIAHDQSKADIARLYRLFHVSRSGFYAARRREQQGAIMCSTSVHLKSAFQASSDITDDIVSFTTPPSCTPRSAIARPTTTKGSPLNRLIRVPEIN